MTLIRLKLDLKVSLIPCKFILYVLHLQKRRGPMYISSLKSRTTFSTAVPIPYFQYSICFCVFFLKAALGPTCIAWLTPRTSPQRSQIRIPYNSVSYIFPYSVFSVLGIFLLYGAVNINVYRLFRYFVYIPLFIFSVFSVFKVQPGRTCIAWLTPKTISSVDATSIRSRGTVTTLASRPITSSKRKSRSMTHKSRPIRIRVTVDTDLVTVDTDSRSRSILNDCYT